MPRAPLSGPFAFLPTFALFAAAACTPGVTPTGSSSTGMGGGSSTGMGGASTTTGGPPTATSTTSGMVDPCAPNEGTPVASTCGVFVRANAMAGGTGSQAAPYPSVAAAVMNLPAAATAIYVCGGDTFKGSIKMRGGVSIYGGFDCTSWIYSGMNPHPVLEGDANTPALSIATSGTENLESIAVHAPDTTTPGGSSIAVMVNGGELHGSRIEVVAGIGQTGIAGAAADGTPPAQAPKGNRGNGDNYMCSTSPPPMPNSGAAEVDFTCPNGTGASIGGKGGDGSVYTGSNGAPGTTGSAGQPGVGHPASGAWSCATTGHGQTGSNGMPGSVGGSGGEGLLGFQGFVAAVGGNGGTGAAAQGGGGGGANEGVPGSGCGSGYIENGSSGGSGGAGGCGGSGGKGGAGGGGSFGIAAISAKIFLVASSITSHAGGKGGAGGAYQPGGAGGAAGPGGANASSVGMTYWGCDGGPGGTGGNGGGGGGGKGGDSTPIVFTGAFAPMVDASTTLTKGTGGPGGTGVGNGTDPGKDGPTGFACGVLAIDLPMCVGQ